MPSSLLSSVPSCRNNDECTAGLFCGGVRTTSACPADPSAREPCRSDRAARRDQDCPRLWHGRAGEPRSGSARVRWCIWARSSCRFYVAGESHLVGRDLSSPAGQEHCDKQDQQGAGDDQRQHETEERRNGDHHKKLTLALWESLIAATRSASRSVLPSRQHSRHRRWPRTAWLSLGAGRPSRKW
jgi:hypothetical protein